MRVLRSSSMMASSLFLLSGLTYSRLALSSHLSTIRVAFIPIPQSRHIGSFIPVPVVPHHFGRTQIAPLPM